jgi:Mg2+/Co2+ transporter CorB
VDGVTSIREFNRETGFELPVSGPRTVSGLITEYLQAMPHSGIAILVANYPIEIIQVKDNRVRLAKIFPRLSEQTF